MPANWHSQVDTSGNVDCGNRSPYLHLFPENCSDNRQRHIELIDSTSPQCLQQLTVQTVSVVVRRLLAECKSYQTIAQIQKLYQGSSTAQKKKPTHQENAAPKNKKQKHSKSRSLDVSKSDQTRETTFGSNAETKFNTCTTEKEERDSSSLPPNNVDGEKPLSGRQKRIAKYALKIEMQSKHMRQRRNHREVRSKTLSGKNRNLLEAMLGTDRFDIQDNPPNNTDSFVKNSCSKPINCEDGENISQREYCSVTNDEQSSLTTTTATAVEEIVGGDDSQDRKRRKLDSNESTWSRWYSSCTIS